MSSTPHIDGQRRKRALTGLIAPFLLALLVLAGCAKPDRMDQLGNQLQCMCSCGQPLIGCNHIDCKSSVPMLKELRAHLDAGESDTQILASFVQKYSVAVRSAPPAKGFHLTVWIAPFVALAAGAFFAVSRVRKWKAAPTTVAPEAPASNPISSNQRRVEEELKRFTPED